jgi:cell wall-associated NlpC family hydrolase
LSIAAGGLALIIALPIIIASISSGSASVKVASAQSNAETSGVIIPDTVISTPMATLDPEASAQALANGNDNTDLTDDSDEYNGDIYADETEKDDTQEGSAMLTPGMESEDIAKLQERLMELDYMEYDEPTGYYGFQTQYALQLFQRQHGLLIDGIAGEETLSLIYSTEAHKYAVRLEDKGTDVKSLQERLQDLGYLTTKATGYFGTATEKAIKAFQKRNSLTVDGTVGSNTRESLYSDKAKKAAVASTSTKKPSSSGSSSGSAGNNSSSSVNTGDLIEFAKSLLGKKYVRGAKGPNTFDCSGFVYYCLKSTGVKIGYMTSGGWANSSYTKISSMSDLKKGDVVCFKGHVALYMGGGQIIDASSSQGKVRITSINSSYWKRTFICGRRV